MPQQERSDEAAARKRVEAATGVALTFADLTGGMDYRFERDGRRCVLEVVRMTDAAFKEGKAAWADGNQVYEATSLSQSWWVITDGHPKYKRMGRRLEPALLDLESHNYDEYTIDMEWRLRREPALRRAWTVLQAPKVEQARPIPTKGPGRQIHLAWTREWMSDGPDGAVEGLDAFLSSVIDVHRKLAESQANERHVFVWTDTDTLGRVRRPLEVGEQLPSRPPSLPEEVTDLWVADEPTGQGWWWSPAAGWAWIPPVP